MLLYFDKISDLYIHIYLQSSNSMGSQPRGAAGNAADIEEIGIVEQLRGQYYLNPPASHPLTA